MANDWRKIEKHMSSSMFTLIILILELFSIIFVSINSLFQWVCLNNFIFVFSIILLIWAIIFPLMYYWEELYEIKVFNKSNQKN